MVFKYQRKTEQASWSESSLQKAIDAVKKDEKSIKSSADKYGIPFATLYRHVKSGSATKKLGRFTPIFTPDQEKSLCEYLKKLDSLFFGLTRTDFLKMVFDYAEKNKIKHPFANGKAGEDWFSGFKKRHPEIVLRTPEPTSIARTRGFNRIEVERFYANYWNQVAKYKFDAFNIYNMDETGVKTTTSKPPKVLTIRGKRQVGVVGSTERGQLTTVICCCNAAGTFIPPFFIFARKKMQARLLDDAPPGSQATVTDNGWVNGEAFLNWLQFFVEKTRPTPDKKVLLLLDNHESHKYYPALEYATKNNVVFVSFAPHTTDRMQPLDVAVYGPLKKYFEQEINVFQKRYPGRIVNQYDIAKIFAGAYAKSASVHNAVQGFRKPGIWPYDPHVFGDEDYAPSTITDRLLNAETISPKRSEPAATNSTSTMVPESRSSIDQAGHFTMQDANLADRPTIPGPTASSAKTPELEVELSASSIAPQELNNMSPVPSPSLIEDFRIDDETTASLRSVQEKDCLPAPSTSTIQRMRSADVITPSEFSPFQVRPIPKPSAPKTNRKCKRQRSEVLTSTPIRDEQALKYEKINTKKIKTSELTGPKTSKAGKAKVKKKTTNKKLKKKENKTANCLCLVCSDEYTNPPTEDWIQCSQCRQWAHEACTSYGGRGSYFCDNCDD